jgi:uncharacterized membrane protein YhaH (DUF805 family)
MRTFFLAYPKTFWKFAVFYGRASRAEFWSFMIMHAAVIVALITLCQVTLDNDRSVADARWHPADALASPLGWLLGAYLIVSVVPTLCLIARRLHDTGRRAWWALLALASYIVMPMRATNATNIIVLCVTAFGLLLVLGFCSENGQECDNEYGADPRTL